MKREILIDVCKYVVVSMLKNCVWWVFIGNFNLVKDFCWFFGYWFKRLRLSLIIVDLVDIWMRYYKLIFELKYD